MQACVFVEPQDGATYADQLAMAQAAERAGFDGFFRSDHFLAMGGDGLPGPTDSWVTLGAIARETSTIRLGTLVTSGTFRHPSLLAIQVAQVDEMSGGRVELGLGAGWFEEEHAAYGFPFPATVGGRLDRLEDQLAVVTGLLSTPLGETFSFAGEHYKLTDSPALPKPVQSSLPIIVGGWGKRRTPAIAARYATEYNGFFADPKEASDQFDRVRAACEAIDRPPEDINFSFAATVFCDTDEGNAQRRAVEAGAPEDATAGTPEQIVEHLLGLKSAGADRVYFQLLEMKDLDHLEMLAAEVVPHL